MRPDNRAATQDSSPSVNHDVVFDGGVALGALQAFGHAQRPQGHALVYLHVGPDDGRFADNEPRAVVDAKGRADARAGMNVDTRALVGVFAQQAGQAGQAALV